MEDSLGGDFIVSVSPLRDSEGKFTGCVHVARNITERKRAEEALRQSEQRVRLKLESILSPTLEMANLELADIVDAQAIQSLMDDFYKLAHIPIGIIDLKGNILVGVGWQDICTRFHRVHPEACEHCIESDTKLFAGVPPGEFKQYKCRNNMWDIATPIIAGGQHVGNIFLGQFFFEGESLDYELFRSQARRYGFNEEEYIAALEKIPRLSPTAVDTIMAFFMKFANILSQLGYSNIKLARSLAERDALVNALQDSEERLRFILETCHIGAWDVDITNHTTIRSPEHDRVYGYDVMLPQWTYEMFLEHVVPEDRARVDATYQHAVKTQSSWSFEFRIRRPDGQIRCIWATGDHRRAADGVVRRVAGIVLDITDRKTAEEVLREAYENLQVQNEELQAQSEEIQVQNEELQAQSEELHDAYELLHESEKHFRTLAENSPDVIARFDRQNRHIYANPAAAKPYGHSQEQIIGKTHTELGMGPEKVGFWEKHHEKVFVTGKPETMGFRYISPQGDEYYFNTRIVPEFVNDKVDSVLAISRDITDIKVAEAKLKETLDNLEELVKERTAELEKAYESLKESEKGLAEAQKMAHLGNWDWDITTNGLYWSDEIYRIFGRTPQEFGATYDAFLSYVHPDDRDYVNNAVIEALNGKPYSIDHRIILANGEEHIVHEQGEVTFDEENNPVRMKGTVQDITERKKAEEKIQTLANSVESSDDAIITQSLDSIITSWNKGAEKVYGYSAEEVLGKPISILEPDNLKGEIKQLVEKIKQGKEIQHYETSRLKKDGTAISESSNSRIQYTH